MNIKDLTPAAIPSLCLKITARITAKVPTLANTAAGKRSSKIIPPKMYQKHATKSNVTISNGILNITQINLQKSGKATKALVSNLVGIPNPVVLASEPQTTTKNLLARVQNDLVLYYYKTKDVRPRAAIMVHKQLSERSWELSQFTTPDQVAIKITIGSQPLILVSSYMDGTKAIPPSELLPVINYAKRHGLPCIIGSDTNSHHYLWGNAYEKNDGRGEDLLEYLDYQDLSWCNRGDDPTFVNSRGHNSVIDLTITNSTGRDFVQNWHVGDQESSSDHRYVKFKISTTTHDSDQRTARITKNTDWDEFSDILEKDIRLKELETSPITTKNDVDEAACKLNSVINDAFKTACPLTYVSNKIKKPAWLTPEVLTARQGVRHRLMRGRTTKSHPEWLAYCIKRKEYETLRKKTIKREWRAFTKSAESVKESARMHKILKHSSNPTEKLEAVYNSNRQVTESAQQTLEAMTDAHFKQPPAGEELKSNTNKTPTNELLERIYDMHRLTEAVKEFVPDKAAGPDGFQPMLIQHGWKHIGKAYQHITKSNHTIQHIPKPWQESNGIFLAKPGKADYRQVKAYRTITLTSVLLKIQEKVILWHMTHDLKIGDQISDRQFGFKKGCSTETALHSVVRCIEKRISKKGYVLGTFLDIEGAFDNVSFKAISESIRKSTVDETTAQWIINMVTNRYITITHKDCKKRINVRRGCPQGGILSPFLWNLVVDDLLKFGANEIPGYLQGFADDLITLSEGSDLEVIHQRTQKTINTIEQWCSTKGLNISALKTKIVMFTWNRKWTLPKPIKVGGNEIELCNSVKFLGVTLDSKLSFNEHVINVTAKATRILMQAKKAVGPTWGMTPKTCKWIYTAVVRPTLTYACVVWVNALKTQTNLLRFERVQRLALNIMSGAFPRTPLISLNHITGTPDIGTNIRGEAAKTAARLKSYGDWTVERVPPEKGKIVHHSTINNNFLDQLNLPKGDYDLGKPKSLLNRHYCTLIPDRNEVQGIIADLPDTALVCYTDGSKSDTGTGFGYTASKRSDNTYNRELSAKLPDYCSVYQAELAAITHAAASLSQVTEQNVTIFTDSQSAINSLNKLTNNSRTAINCHSALEHLATRNTVNVVWVPGHEGHWGNEEADRLAKIGTTASTKVVGYLPYSFIKRSIDVRVREESAKLWSSNAPRHSALALNNNIPHIKKLSCLINDRNGYRTAIQLITGTIGLNYHLHKIKIVPSPVCDQCQQEDETVGHFLGTCPAFSMIRGEYFNTYYASLTEIFENNSILKIVKYAKRTKRLEYDPEATKGRGVT